jgi:hypothetical protein
MYAHNTTLEDEIENSQLKETNNEETNYDKQQWNKLKKRVMGNATALATSMYVLTDQLCAGLEIYNNEHSLNAGAITFAVATGAATYDYIKKLYKISKY